jgi:3-oxoadipate enol-lactonase
MATARAADGTEISYRVFGAADGEPLVLIMGLGADRWGWVRQWPSLRRRFRLLALDNRGSGASGVPDGPYDLEVMAADVIAVMDAEGIGSAHVMGASLGGVLAQIIAIRHPGRVRSLVLACTACRMKSWRRALFTEWIEIAQAEGSHALARENIRWVVAARHLRRLWPISPVVAPLIIRAPVPGVVAQLQALVDAPEAVGGFLGEISVPTFVIVGSQDILTPVADSEELVEAIPDARLEVISSAAHGFMVMRAGRYNDAVAGFYDEIRGS